MAGEGGDSEGVTCRNCFSGGPARRFISSFATDERIFGADLVVDRVHAVMLASQDIIESEVASEILAALDEVETTGYDMLSGGKDIYEAIEATVIDIVGPDDGKMHTARSRSDEVATCIRYHLHKNALPILGAALVLHESLFETATAHTETMMPGYTYLQPAQPTTVACFLPSYERVIARGCVRLIYVYECINQSPPGSAAFVGMPLGMNCELTANLLGFDRVMESSMDVSATRDFLTETLSAFTTHAVTPSGLVMDLVIFSSRGLIELLNDYPSASSVIPQKKNPDTMGLVRAVTGDTVGELTDLPTTLKGLPRTYNRDLQRVHKHAFRIVGDMGEAVAVAAGVVASAAWPEDELAATTGDGFSTATDVADLLAMVNLPFRTVHEIVMEATARSEETSNVATLGVIATDVLGESLFTHMTAETVEAALDPTESVANRDSVGRLAPATVGVTLSMTHDELSDDAAVVAGARDLLAVAAEGLNEEVSSYI